MNFAKKDIICTTEPVNELDNQIFTKQDSLENNDVDGLTEGSSSQQQQEIEDKPDLVVNRRKTKSYRFAANSDRPNFQANGLVSKQTQPTTALARHATQRTL